MPRRRSWRGYWGSWGSRRVSIDYFPIEYKSPVKADARQDSICGRKRPEADLCKDMVAEANSVDYSEIAKGNRFTSRLYHGANVIVQNTFQRKQQTDGQARDDVSTYTIVILRPTNSVKACIDRPCLCRRCSIGGCCRPK